MRDHDHDTPMKIEKWEIEKKEPMMTQEEWLERDQREYEQREEEPELEPKYDGSRGMTVEERNR